MRSGAPFADYLLFDSLGRNAAAELFAARRRIPGGGGLVVAVVHEELSRDRAVQRAWLDESSQLQSVDHRGLARLEQLGEASGILYGAWSKAAGPSLRELGESGAPWPLPALLQLSAQLFAALEGLHGALPPGLSYPLAHGDLRPSTLRIEGTTLKVLELGLGRSLIRAGGLRKTWPPGDYAPPERAREPGVAPPADVYSGTLAIWEHVLPRGAATPPRADDLRSALARAPLAAEVRDALASALGTAADRPSASELRRLMARAVNGLGAAAGPDALASFTGAPVTGAMAAPPLPPSPSSQNDIRPGDQVGPYEVLELIAAGGMGRVWRARDTGTRELVALKTISPDRMEDPKFLRRFLEEAKAGGAAPAPERGAHPGPGRLRRGHLLHGDGAAPGQGAGAGGPHRRAHPPPAGARAGRVHRLPLLRGPPRRPPAHRRAGPHAGADPPRRLDGEHLPDPLRRGEADRLRDRQEQARRGPHPRGRGCWAR